LGCESYVVGKKIGRRSKHLTIPPKAESESNPEKLEGGFAMAKSFQDEIPPSRVNIRYHNLVTGEEKIELPLKLLLLGDYTFQEDDTPLEERKKLSIDKDNFKAVMREQGLKLEFGVENRLTGNEEDEIDVELDIDSLEAMTPDEIVKHIPELQKMVGMRNLLNELKARVVTNRKFRLALEKIVKDQGQLEAFMQELDHIAPLQDEASSNED
jgi:type VI secretion system protein ImpB